MTTVENTPTIVEVLPVVEAIEVLLAAGNVRLIICIPGGLLMDAKGQND